MLKRPLAAAAALVLMAGLSACSGDEDGPTSARDSSDETSQQPDNPDGADCVYVEGGTPAKAVDLPPDKAAYDGDVDMTISLSAGDVDVTLDAAAAPCTVNSFTSLAAQGYFDDTTCHRLTTGPYLQVLQCGDPTPLESGAAGSGGPGYTFADELTGKETYGAGTLAMANAGADTNGSQFFIVYGDSQLGPDYTVFGSVDPATLGVVEDLAADGVEGGFEDGPPATTVTIDGMTVN